MNKKREKRFGKGAIARSKINLKNKLYSNQITQRENRMGLIFRKLSPGFVFRNDFYGFGLNFE
jgi:hypothetical protein